jgi:YHS domain-containing protein
MAKDPICNTEVDEETAEFESQYASQTYFFF